MIQEFVDRFMERKDELRSKFTENAPASYKAIVKGVVEILHDPDECGSISPERIHVINDGSYQGTLVFVIGADDYQPDDYWYVRVYYGSCSGCDTLEAIGYPWEGAPSEKQLDGYMTLALHIVQRLKQMDREGA